MATNARHFTRASSNKVTLSLGSVGAFGPATIAAIVNVTSTGNYSACLSGGVTDPVGWTFGHNNASPAKWWVYNGSVDALSLTSVTTGIWMFVAVTKATGSAQPRFHLYDYATPPMVHENSATSLGNSSAPITNARIGCGDAGGDFFDGDIQVGAYWNTVLSDAALEGLVSTRLAWLAAAPVTMWTLNQASTATAITDEADSANETALVGTSVVTGNPDWDDSLAPWPPADSDNSTATIRTLTAARLR